MTIDVKICGLSTAETVAAAVEGGAKYVGFVFYPPSPRMVTPEAARALAAGVPKHVKKVGLAVNPDDKTLQEIVPGGFLDMLQLHGSEVPERVAEIKARFGLPVIKCVFVDKPEDVEIAQTYEAVADMLLFDALAPGGSQGGAPPIINAGGAPAAPGGSQGAAALPGGNALAFDWNLIHGRTWKRPWLLAGGLNVGNLETAIAISGARAVDVSSGVEISHGVKCPDKIRAFLELAGTLPK